MFIPELGEPPLPDLDLRNQQLSLYVLRVVGLLPLRLDPPQVIGIFEHGDEGIVLDLLA